MGRVSFWVLGITIFWLTSGIFLSLCLPLFTEDRWAGIQGLLYQSGREGEPGMGFRSSPHRELGLSLPIPVLRKQEYDGFHGCAQPGPFIQQWLHFPGRILIHIRAVTTATSSESVCPRWMLVRLHRLTPSESFPWPEPHSRPSSQRVRLPQVGFTPLRSVNAGPTYYSLLLSVRGSSCGHHMHFLHYSPTQLLYSAHLFWTYCFP